MRIGLVLSAFFWGYLLFPYTNNAQENQEISVEESADVSHVDYSDTFQENFFNALKQKGIENYDKAINLMLECKEIDSINPVIDHELAKLYAKEKQFALAEEYALTAVLAEPTNLWFVVTYQDALQKQQKPLEAVKELLPYDNDKFKENLALAYFRKGKAKVAESILDETTKSAFTEQLSVKVSDLIKRQEKAITKSSYTMANANREESGSLNQYKARIQGMLRADNYLSLAQVAGEALESYPLQPYFYYALGYAYNKKSKPRDAIEILESGLDYLVGDPALANKFYNELAEAYNTINNSVKANMYLRKIKPGF